MNLSQTEPDVVRPAEVVRGEPGDAHKHGVLYAEDPFSAEQMSGFFSPVGVLFSRTKE